MGGKFSVSERPPADRLERTHRRIEEKLEELVARCHALPSARPRAEEWLALDEIESFLVRAMPRHEQDEEESVFPRLARHPALRNLIQRLQGDHLSHRKKNAEISLRIRTRDTRFAELEALSRRLQRDYLDHIKREDRELLPAMARYLSEDEQREIAKEMAARRLG